MRRHGSRENGAAAVEFALVVPLLLLLVFGMIDYGLYFTNQLAVQQGVRDAARQAVVGPPFGSTPSCGMSWTVSPNADGRRLGCTVLERTHPFVGTSHVKIKIPPGGWEKGRALTVCEMVRTEGLTGFVPMPNGGVVATRVEISIERDLAAPPSGGEQAPPAGATWSWC